MTLSAIGFSLMSLFVKFLTPAIPHFQLVFFRSFINLLASAAVIAISREALFPKGEIRLLVFRGLFGFGSLTCLFYSITRLPLAVASMLSWCSPIFVILFSYFFIGERLRRVSIAWIGIAFAGLLMILRPGDQSTALPLSAVMIGLLGSAFAGSAYVAVRAATARVGVQLIIFYFVLIATLISAPLAYRVYRAPDPRQWIELLLMGLSATAGQFMMTQGYRFAPAGIVSTMSLLGASLSAAFGWIFFGENLALIQWLGILVLATGIILLTWSGTRPSRSAPIRTR